MNSDPTMPETPVGSAAGARADQQVVDGSEEAGNAERVAAAADGSASADAAPQTAPATDEAASASQTAASEIPDILEIPDNPEIPEIPEAFETSDVTGAPAISDDMEASEAAEEAAHASDMTMASATTPEIELIEPAEAPVTAAPISDGAVSPVETTSDGASEQTASADPMEQAAAGEPTLTPAADQPRIEAFAPILEPVPESAATAEMMSARETALPPKDEAPAALNTAPPAEDAQPPIEVDSIGVERVASQADVVADETIMEPPLPIAEDADVPLAAQTPPAADAASAIDDEPLPTAAESLDRAAETITSLPAAHEPPAAIGGVTTAAPVVDEPVVDEPALVADVAAPSGPIAPGPPAAPSPREAAVPLPVHAPEAVAAEQATADLPAIAEPPDHMRRLPAEPEPPAWDQPPPYAEPVFAKPAYPPPLWPGSQLAPHLASPEHTLPEYAPPLYAPPPVGYPQASAYPVYAPPVYAPPATLHTRTRRWPLALVSVAALAIVVTLVVALAGRAFNVFGTSNKVTTLYANAMTAVASDWPSDQDCSFQSDGYHITGASNCYYSGKDYQDVTVTTTSKLVKGDPTGAYGIAFRRPSPNKYYVFLITGTGNWLVARDDTSIAPVQHSTAIKTGIGAVNTIAVRMQGSHFTFFANGTQLGDLTDNTYAAGKVGLAGDTNIEVAFKDFTVTQP